MSDRVAVLLAALLAASLLMIGAVAAVAAPGVSAMPRFHGVASWYGARFEGRRMSNGCRFHANALTAASRTLPLGSWIKVSRGDRSVVVPVTDRGPYVSGRVLDLSRAAAERLDMLAAGLVMVSIEPISARLPVGCRHVG